MVYLGIVSMIVAMGVTFVVTPWVIRLAGRLGAIDLPGGRKTHATPMPRIGGVAVYLGFIAGLGTAAFLAGVLLDPPRVEVYWQGAMLAATAIFLVGLIDDLWEISYRLKFAAQIACAVFVWYSGFRVEVVTSPLGGGFELGWLSLPITVLWIVAITNAVNLLDGLDGLAAGTALITTVSIAIIGFAMNTLGITAACVALAGALIGFLRYNFNPARIFLGDSGSMFLGFVLAVATVRGSQKLPTTVIVLVPLLVLALPLIDTSMTVLRRLYRVTSDSRLADGTVRHLLGNLNRVFLPDRDHIHHRLIDTGLSHRRTVLTLYAVAVASACVAFVLTFVNSREIGFLLLGVLVGALAALLAFLYLRVRRLGRDSDESRPTEPGSLAVGKPWSPGEPGAQRR
jgi:UDP-GlcNAc:undecaprenyl-phosphate GlcNAc-1-phosphate transferase